MKLIERTLKNLLVEFEDGGEVRRVWIPAGSALTVENARRGADVGPTAEDIEALGLRIDPEKLLHGLHRRGIWTADDIRRAGGGSKVKSALLQSLGWATSQLINIFLDRR